MDRQGNGSSQRKTAHNAAVSARAAAPAEGVLSSIRPVPLLTGLEPPVLVQQSVYCCKYKIYIIFLKPLDNKFPIWYNKTLSPLEPGESYLMLIDNRIPNNRYVPGAPAGRATWLMQPDRRIATDGCAMTDSGVNDTSVRSCRRTLPGVRRPWRQPATVHLLWLHMVLAGTVRPSGKMIIKSDLTVMENHACNI